MREDRRRKADREKLTFKIGYVQKKISNFLKKLPWSEKKKFESEQEKNRRHKLKEIKETMWKKSRVDGEILQTGENLQTGETTYNLENLEGKLETIETIYNRYKEEEMERVIKSEEEKKTEKEKKRKYKRG